MTKEEWTRVERLISVAVTAAVLAWATTRQAEVKATAEVQEAVDEVTVTYLETAQVRQLEWVREFILSTSRCDCPEEP